MAESKVRGTFHLKDGRIYERDATFTVVNGDISVVEKMIADTFQSRLESGKHSFKYGSFVIRMDMVEAAEFAGIAELCEG